MRDMQLSSYLLGLVSRAREAYRQPNLRDTFSKVYKTNFWGGDVSRSGTGSDLRQTSEIKRVLPSLIRRLNAQVILDIPCGDFFWMKEVEHGIQYVGADIVPELITDNTARYANDRRRFIVRDLCNDALPRADIVFCRDALVHLSYQDAMAAIRNIKVSESLYLMATTFTNRSANFDMPTTGEWRPLNMQVEPFLFPEPLEILIENCTEGDGSWGDKSLGLWRIQDL